MHKYYPKVSIITPSYNQAQFIEETITSVLNQDYPNIEYIIIDGLSTDGSVDIIRKYEDQLAYWVSETDHGQCHAINKGFSRAEGKILAWLNSDDVYRSGAIKKVVEAFNAHPDAAAIVGTCAIVNKRRNVLTYKKPVDFDPRRLLCGGSIPGQPAVFLKRQVFEELGGLNEELHYVLDWEYWLRIGMHFPEDRVVLLDRVIAEIRIWLGNKTSYGYGITEKVKKDRVPMNIVERSKVLDDIFSKPELNNKLRGLEKVAYSRTYWRQAKYEFRVGQSIAARRNFIKAYQMAPEAYSIIGLFRNITETYLGYPMIERIRSVHRLISSTGNKSHSEIGRYPSPY